MNSAARFLMIARVLIIAAGIGIEFAGAPAAVRNAAQCSALLLICILSIRDRAPAPHLPFFKHKFAGPALILAVAAAVSSQMWPIGYFGDDYALIERARRAATPFDWLTPGEPSAGNFERPVAWFFWWCYEHCTPGAATAARAVSNLLFCINAWLVAVALRRLSVRRGVAIAAALIFALHPFALGTIAWLSNCYSQLSLTFGLAAIAAIPRRRITAAALAPSLVLYLLALLSKEDVFLLFPLAGIAAAGCRWRRWRRGAAVAGGFFLILLIALAIRFAALGSLGSYQSDTKLSMASMWLPGARQLFIEDFPGRYWLPLRECARGLGERAPEGVYSIPLMIWLAMGGLAPGSRRTVALGFFILILGVAPVAPLALLGPDLINTRLLFFPTVGVALMLAGSIAGLRRLGPVRWVFIMIGCAIAWRLGARNLASAREAYEIHERAFRDVAAIAQELPPGASIQIDGLEDDRNGVPLFGGSFTWGFPRRAGRADITFHRSEVGRFDQFLEFNKKTASLFDPLAVAAEFIVKPGETLTIDFGKESGGRAASRVFESIAFDEAGVWNVRGTGAGRNVRLPALRAPAPCSIQIEIDGGFEPGFAGPVPLRAIYKIGSHAVRVDVKDNKIALPVGVDILQLEIVPRIQQTLRLRALRVRAEK
ncbi:MAG: hypothetical protein HY286_07985 [Planctomycetes bacterium]|nr:hypothetical protein [Planctomycetota bacterium]